MANELEVAGEFIYAAIDKFNRMDNFDQVGDYFFFLYHLAVGIERVQKILLVIINDIKRDSIEDFLEEIKSHNHMMLHSKIKEKVNISFSREQNDLLILLATFYNAERYTRFDFFSYDFKDRDLLIEYVQKYCEGISFDFSLCKKIPLNTNEVKEFFGRVIGRLCQKYYKAIEEESRNRNIYCYELRYNSAAERVFCGNEDKGSYQKKIDKEKRAIKELLIYLRSPREMNKFIEYMDQIESLPFDVASIQEYVADLCNKTVSSDLIDEVHYMYEEFVENKDAREQMVSLIGRKGVMFDWGEE
jgi:hypothetical protein